MFDVQNSKLHKNKPTERSLKIESLIHFFNLQPLFVCNDWQSARLKEQFLYIEIGFTDGLNRNVHVCPLYAFSFQPESKISLRESFLFFFCTNDNQE